MLKPIRRLLFACFPALLPAAQESATADETVAEIVVYGRAQTLLGAASSASEGTVGYLDLELPPLLRVGELVEAVPGMVATQHSGSGKANQYFLRGFNLDHGTDFLVTVDGVPVNFRTHGHGQGYLDLNFLIPELVETITYRKGIHHADAGDFSSAGSADFRYYEQLEEKTARLSVGDNEYVDGFVAGSFDAGSGTLTAAGDLTFYAGPWELDEELQQLKTYVAYRFPVAGAMARVSFSGYSSNWNSTDQVPLRAVQSGLIDPLGYIDPDLGGSTDRYSVAASFEYDNLQTTAYMIDYDLSLLSNFTYQLEDPVSGDQFEQVDQRRVYGATIRGHTHLGGSQEVLRLRWGGDLQYDDIDRVGLFPTEGGQRIGVIRDDSVRVTSLGAYGDLQVTVGDRLRASAGLRADQLRWNVEARNAANSGQGNDTLTSPKFNLAYRLGSSAELYANWGEGFHSNDVRGVTIRQDPVTGAPVDNVEPLVKSDGGEVGLRIELGDMLNVTVTRFLLNLDSELVFVGDRGGTEASPATRRIGTEIAGFWQATEWLAANFNVTSVDAKFREVEGSGRAIPGAVETVISLGLNAAWNNKLFASARARYLGVAPLVEDGSVWSDGSLLVNAGIGYRWHRSELRLDAFNLFNSNDDDIAYFYASRLDGEPDGGVEDIHFHPLEPRALRLSLTYRWQ